MVGYDARALVVIWPNAHVSLKTALPNASAFANGLRSRAPKRQVEGVRMGDGTHTLGTVSASEQLLRDLYIDLRAKVHAWANITKQTAQARMGYIGQHLTSVVTGHPGGRSGARGRDLVLPNDEYGEIKTCYRVDQLGVCNNCGAKVASIEERCPRCDSNDITRHDDSKWLITIRNDDEFAGILEPKYYYLVLFDFADENRQTIEAAIWEVDPKVPGFALAMLDYYWTIKANSASRAPFNLWPAMLKFYLTRPTLIYRALIAQDGRIDTKIFQGRDKSVAEVLPPLPTFSHSSGLTLGVARQILRAFGGEKALLAKQSNKRELLVLAEEARNRRTIANHDLCDAISRAMYMPRIEPHLGKLPKSLRSTGATQKALWDKER